MERKWKPPISLIELIWNRLYRHIGLPGTKGLTALANPDVSVKSGKISMIRGFCQPADRCHFRFWDNPIGLLKKDPWPDYFPGLAARLSMVWQKFLPIPFPMGFQSNLRIPNPCLAARPNAGMFFAVKNEGMMMRLFGYGSCCGVKSRGPVFGDLPGTSAQPVAYPDTKTRKTQTAALVIFPHDAKRWDVPHFQSAI